MEADHIGPEPDVEPGKGSPDPDLYLESNLGRLKYTHTEPDQNLDLHLGRGHLTQS